MTNYKTIKCIICVNCNEENYLPINQELDIDNDKCECCKKHLHIQEETGEKRKEAPAVKQQENIPGITWPYRIL